MSSFGFGFGMQRLVDANQRLYNNGVPVFYVIENFRQADFEQITELGFSYSGAVPGKIAGTQDIQIEPPPQSSELSLQAINAASTADKQLRIGSMLFTISNTWVAAMQAQLGFASPDMVFDDDSVQGIRYRNLLFEIVNAIPNRGFATDLSWSVYCNAPMRDGDTQ